MTDSLTTPELLAEGDQMVAGANDQLNRMVEAARELRTNTPGMDKTVRIAARALQIHRHPDCTTELIITLLAVAVERLSELRGAR